MPKLLTISQVSIELRVPGDAIRNAVRRGVINPPQVGRHRAYPVDQLPAYREALERAGVIKSAAVAIA